ncbi:lipase family protein [Williamsia herbipolensis]|uniref:Lipase family protein n=1 Tax=Williamsia herbipolensis TaxID=1603258 RepID=A0AAU4JYD8_9NOCA|nr:lipase family protein [Williamsia herbipolensis]
MTQLTTLIATFAVVFGGLVATQAAAEASPPSPSFYSPPAGFETTAPGTVLKFRATTVATIGLPLPIGVRAWQLLYRTSDESGRPTATVTTVLAPPPSRSTSRLLSYQLFEDATAPQCAPSRNLSTGADLDGVLPASASLVLVAAALNRGWTVAIPDHEGQNSRFTAPREPGYAVLDGIRAATRFSPTGLSSSSAVGVAGYSGGALATGWAAQVQPRYAPEINLVGAAMGGTPVDIGAVPEHLDGSLEAGIGLFVIAGLRHSYPRLSERLDRYLTPAGRAAFARLSRGCAVSNTLLSIGQSYGPLFNRPFRTVWRDPVIRSARQQAQLGGDPTTVPRFIYHAVADEVVPVSGVDRYITSECARGAQITERREALGLHVTTALTGLPASLDWLDRQSRSASPPRTSVCDIATVPSLVTTSPGSTLRTLEQSVRAMFGLTG